MSNDRQLLMCYLLQVRASVAELHAAGQADDILSRKSQERSVNWYHEAAACRAEELRRMADCFMSQDYNTSRAAFVFKQGKPGYVNVDSPLKEFAGLSA